MNRCHFFLLLCVINSPLLYANFNEPAGARSSGLGNHYTTLSDVFSANNNQAGLGFIKDYSFGISARNRFILSELNRFYAVAALPTKTGTFGLNLSYFGQPSFNEKKIGIGFGKAFGEKFSAGLQFDYLNIAIEEYGQRHLFTFEVGMQYKILEELSVGAHLFNPLRLDITEESDEKLPTVMRFGLSYTPSKKIALLAEVDKDLDFQPVYKVGIEYKVIDKLTLRTGFNANPFSAAFGVGLFVKDLVIDVSSTFHPVLGVSPALSLLYVVKKKKEKNEMPGMN